MPPEVLARVRAEALPRMFDMVASGHLHLDVQARPLTDVERVWAAAERAGTRTVLVP